LTRAPISLSALAVALLISLAGARAAESEYAPRNIKDTYDKSAKYCYFQSLCPYSPEMRKLIEQAISKDRSAQYRLGLTLLTGDGLPRDRDAGLAWVVLAAEQGEPAAARYVAGRLRNGEAIEIDETKVAEALKPQAAAGNLEAMRALAPMIIAGRGAKQDPAQGLALLTRAAEMGSTEAENELFQLYQSGAPNIPANRAEAMKWLTMSARHGNIDAMNNLGYKSISASMNERNLIEGYCWLVRAAMTDNGQAQEKLALTFALGEKDGHGAVLAIDLIQADLWMRVAARSLYHDNSQIRSRIEPNMTTDQLNEAKRLFQAWRPLGVNELKAQTIALPASMSSASAPRTCAPMN
jgi:TPR repeat protein